MTTQAQPAPAAPAPAPVYEHIDCLQLAFDQIKRLEAIGNNPQLSARNHDYNLAQLWLGLATALEIRLLRREQAAREKNDDAAAARASAAYWQRKYSDLLGEQEEGEP